MPRGVGRFGAPVLRAAPLRRFEHAEWKLNRSTLVIENLACAKMGLSGNRGGGAPIKFFVPPKPARIDPGSPPVNRRDMHRCRKHSRRSTGVGYRCFRHRCRSNGSGALATGSGRANRSGLGTGVGGGGADGSRRWRSLGAGAARVSGARRHRGRRGAASPEPGKSCATDCWPPRPAAPPPRRPGDPPTRSQPRPARPRPATARHDPTTPHHRHRIRPPSVHAAGSIRHYLYSSVPTRIYSLTIEAGHHYVHLPWSRGTPFALTATPPPHRPAPSRRPRETPGKPALNCAYAHFTGPRRNRSTRPHQSVAWSDSRGRQPIPPLLTGRFDRRPPTARRIGRCTEFRKMP